MSRRFAGLGDRPYLVPATLVAALALGVAIPALDVADGIARAARDATSLDAATRSWGVAWTGQAVGVAATRAAAIATLAKLLAAAGAVALAIAAITLWAIFATRAQARRAEWNVHRAVGASRTALVRGALGDGAVAAVWGLLLGLALAGAGVAVARASWPETANWSAGALGAATLKGAAPLALFIVLLAIAPLLALRTRAALAFPPVVRRGSLVLAVQLGVALAILLAAARVAGAHDLALGAPHAADGLVYRIAAPADRSPAERAALYGTLLDTLVDDPGVGAAAIASPGMFLGLGTTDLAITDCGACSQGGLPAPFHPVAATYHLVSPDTFEAAGIPIVTGRTLRRHEGAEPVAIVNRALALRHFEREGAVGRRIRVGKSPGTWHRVVGVADDRPPAVPGAARSRFAVYLSALQYPATELELFVPAASEPRAVRHALADVLGPAAPPPEPTPLEAERRAAAQPVRWLTAALAIAGGAALLLATFGVAVVAALTAARRRAEFALRRAVGARARDVRRLALSDVGKAVLLGLAFGWWLDLLTAGFVTSAAGVATPPGIAIGAGLAALLAASAFAGASGLVRRVIAVMPSAALEPDGS